MHFHLRSYFCLALIIAAFPAIAASQNSDSNVVDEVVAVVDGDIILRSEVDGVLYNTIMREAQQGRTGLAYSDQAWMDFLDQMIERKILVSHAKRDTNLTVADSQVDQMLDEEINLLASQVGGPAQLERMYGQSLLEVKADLRPEFRERILADQLRNKKLASIRATPTEVKEWFANIPTDSLPTFPDQVQLSQIVRLPSVTDEAREEANEIISAIRDSVVYAGASMEEMARLFSDDGGSASNGGLYENSTLDELVPEFAAVASRTPVGTYSPVFETQFGLHFLRVNARRGDTIDYNHILIQFDERKSDPASAIRFLQVLRDSVMHASASFSALARDHSEEELSAARGGRVVNPRSGERNLVLQDLGAIWQSTIRDLEPGQISEPTETQLLDGRRAYHIVRLDAFIPAHRVSLETDYKLIERLATQDKQARVMEEWIERLKESVYIDLRGKAARLAS